MALLCGTTVDDLLAGAHIANSEDLQAMLSWLEARPDIFPPECKFCVADLRWAASVVASRSFDCSMSGVALVPFGDALNHHSRQPHTRMRETDGGRTIVFIADRSIVAGEEVFNFYGEHGNIQWLLNGGFVEQSNPFDSLPVTPSEVISAVLSCPDQGHRPHRVNGTSLDTSESPANAVDDSDEHSDNEPSELLACNRIAFLQQLDICSNEDVFSVRSQELLPDSLATLILALRMSRAQFLEFQQRPRERHLIDLTIEHVSEDLLADLYRCLLRLCDLVDKRYDTSFDADLQKLGALEGTEVHRTIGVEQPPQKLARTTPEASQEHVSLAHGVRPQNALNALRLRVAQRQILQQLRDMSAQCFVTASSSSDSECPVSSADVKD